ncbi:MAG TPA: polysaccharide biosynthesis/export family protein [Caulobacteraceae bacterium]|nr:polysaccharide biosynthesis/export family protein [Caulobacteraceae bacterium]
MSQPSLRSPCAGAIAVLLTGVLALGGCGSTKGGPTDTWLPPPDSTPLTASQAEYVIGPLDKLSVTVFQAPDLSLKGAQVDAGGRITFPLIGQVQASGRTASQLATDISAALGKSYMQSPEVSVTVDEAASQKVTVEGAVVQPGVFNLTGPTTLLETIAMARGPDKTADLRNVAIFRTIQGKRAAAVFDLKAIRLGEAPDPTVYGNDIVVVQGSDTRGIWQELLRAAPLIGVFRFF